MWKGLIYNGVDYSMFLEVSDNGTIRRVGSNHVLSYCKNHKGYPIVSTTLGSRKNKKTFRIHRAVACTYLENPNAYAEINHIDGNKENNSVGNLEWCTRSQNQKHACALGLADTPNRTVITDRDVIEKIKSYYIRGVRGHGVRALANQYGVSRTAICSVLNT